MQRRYQIEQQRAVQQFRWLAREQNPRWCFPWSRSWVFCKERRAHRWGKEDGYCVVDGHKVPIRRTRLRNQQNREQRLGSYELFQRSAPQEQAVWDKMMRGLSTRNYGAVVKDFCRAYGLEKSEVSDNFIEASRESSRN